MKIFFVYCVLSVFFLVDIPAWDVGEDRTRFGERLLLHEVQILNSVSKLFLTVDAESFSVRERSAMGRVFRLPPASIKKFRRGMSFAPVGHHLNKTHWYTVWFAEKSQVDGESIELRTLRIVNGDMVVEEKYWPRFGL
tara:strand:- start:368 stop:781 length:414 start_codon:yes stop_codon:yes gene_type:complete